MPLCIGVFRGFDLLSFEWAIVNKGFQGHDISEWFEVSMEKSAQKVQPD